MKRVSKSLSLLLLTLLLGAITLPAFAAGQKYAIDPYHTQVYFTWDHVGFSNPGAVVNASKGTLTWNAKHPEKSSVSVTIPVADIDTQVPALDAIFREKFFEAKKYPTATFKSTNVQQIGKSNHYQVKGKLTLHGVTQPVTLDATLNKTGKLAMLKSPAIGFDATTTIKRSAFGLGQYVPMVGDKVKIRITLQAVSPDALQKEKKQIQAEMQAISKST